MADLQAEVVSLRGHKDRCEHSMLRLLRELLQVRACVQLQDSELKRLQQEGLQVARGPEEACEVSHPWPGGSPHPEARLPCSRCQGSCFLGPEPSSAPAAQAWSPANR